MKKNLWVPPSLFAIAIKRSDLSFASIQQTFVSNSRSVERTEQTFAVFTGLSAAQMQLPTVTL